MSYATIPSQESIDRTIAALKPRGVEVIVVDTKEQALEEVKKMIPAGSDVMTGSSITLEQIGIIDMLKSHNHPWKNLKDAIFAETDPTKQGMLRKQSVLSEYFLGSVHAIAETGEIVVASGSGSQLPSYAFSSNHVIWIAGAHKITPTLADAITRVREYVLPLEDKRMKSTGAPGSVIGKLLIIEKEIMPNRKLKLILVKEVLGF